MNDGRFNPWVYRLMGDKRGRWVAKWLLPVLTFALYTAKGICEGLAQNWSDWWRETRGLHKAAREIEAEE